MVRRVQDQRGQCISREQSPGQFSEELLEKILRGISAQNYTDTVIDSAQAFGVSPSSVSRRMVSLDVIQALTQASWPGNVRELQHYLERAVVPTTGPELSCKDIVAMGSEAAEHDLRTVARGATRQAERARILQALQQQGANGPRSPSFSGSAGPAATTSSAPMGCVTREA